MTDDLALDLEKVASAVPAMPNDYAYLKSLIQSLPSPLAPELRSAKSSEVATNDPGQTAASQIGNSMIGGSIGVESGAATGIVSELFYGNANLILNPLMEDPPSPATVNLSTTAYTSSFMHAWYGHYVITSGSDPFPAAGYLHPRTDDTKDPLNTALVEIDMNGAVGGATNYTVYIYNSPSWWPGYDPGLAYVTASVKITPYGNVWDANVTLFRARMEITNNAGTVVKAYGPWFDLMAVTGSQSTYRLSAAYAKPGGGWDSEGHGWRLRVDMTRSSAGGGDVLLIGEPALTLSATQAPPPFSPIIAKWVPGLVNVYGSTGALPSLIVGDDRTLGGSITWSAASTTSDVRLSRSAVRTLRIDGGDLANNGQMTLEIGAPNSGDEGAEIILEGAAAHPDWHIDNMGGQLRVFDASVRLAVDSTGIWTPGRVDADGGLDGSTVHAPVESGATSADKSTTSGTFVDLGSPFDQSIVAPPSGRVLLLATLELSDPGAQDVTIGYQLDSGSDVTIGAHAFDGQSVRQATTVFDVITGLTPGTTYAVSLRWKTTGGTAVLAGATRGAAGTGSRMLLLPLP